MAILPASLTENNNSSTASNAPNLSITSTSNSHYHQQHQRYQQQHNQQQQQQQHQRHHSPNSPPASPHREPKYFQQQQQQLSPPYSTCTRRQSISPEEDLSEFSSSSSSSSLFYDEDFSSSSSTDDDDHHRNLKNTRIKSPPHSPPHSPQRRYYNYNSNNYSNNSYNASPPRTPNKNANNNANKNNKYMHSYKKPIMPARNLYLAMDCEMIQTIQHESIAARVVLVDWKGRTVLDTYIHHPAEQVVDYKTFVSGITPQHLEDAPSFAHVQQQVQDLLQDKILVGHGLENDLKALQIMDHPWWMIRDTAYYQPFMQERVVPGSGLWMPRKLRDLVQEKLPQCYDNDFQKDGTAHCPAADAKAALDLYKSHRPRWEACMIQHVKKSTAAITTSPLQQGFMMMSPCSVMMMPSHKLQEHQQSPMMSPQQMAMMLPTPALALSSPMASAAVAATPFYSSPSSSPSHSVRSSKPVWSSSRQQQQQQHLHPTFTALPSLPF